jgi:hypothetical protein
MLFLELFFEHFFVAAKNFAHNMIDINQINHSRSPNSLKICPIAFFKGGADTFAIQNR